MRAAFSFKDGKKLPIRKISRRISKEAEFYFDFKSGEKVEKMFTLKKVIAQHML
jgi:hypothetical protein